MNTKTILVIIAIVVSIGILFELQGRFVTGSPNISSTSGISLSTNPDPLQPGPATFLIEVKDKNGKPVDDAKVSYDLNMTTMNMGPQQGDATPQGNGRYSAVGRMTMRGPWRVSAKVTMPDGSVENRDFTVDVP
ncbi:hypothetical protein COY90_02160 [Candidatus Roizmanbacteria bacterium CG_4_10_14_0_8_um_filter_39_9]|uniref:YtkA-like domain-containing protein n=1 Tax=Candidatus Roizmanbacteria bacterium CG_4_10_14_0_8_um_filter_39_9 TaxID=1974829 RepID=A0A2M7QD56_9BACT|nr:MAG: hypothetical protein COY90_02160 [Candidatus Roizmanbacteria bacterium CG_4_10_14_0_8_um_filter_39_9]